MRIDRQVETAYLSPSVDHGLELMRIQGIFCQADVRREKQGRKDALKAARDAAAKVGFVMADLLAQPKARGKGRRRHAKGPKPARFKDPISEKTWSGMGRPSA